MPDIVQNISEDIFKIGKDCNIPAPFLAIIAQQHEEIRMLQEYCKELSVHMSQIIEALKFSQSLYKDSKARLARIEQRYTDANQGLVNPEQINDGN